MNEKQKSIHLYLLFIYVVLAILWPIDSYSQNSSIKFDHLSTDQGLSSGAVECVYKDSKGYMWIGTRDGLNRFNGYTFTIFKHDNKDDASISGNNITSIVEDKQGRIWVGTLDDGISVFDWETEIFTNYKHNQKDTQSIADNRIHKILIDEENNVLVATGGGLDIYDRKSDSFEHIKRTSEELKGYNSKSVHSIIQDAPGFFWVRPDFGGVELFDLKNKTFEKFEFDDFNNLIVNRLKPLYKDSKGFLWVGTGVNGVYRVDRQHHLIKHFTFNPANNGLNSNIITSFYEDDQNRIWIGTDGGGINIYNTQTDSFSYIKKNIYINTSLSSDVILEFYEDDSDILWVSTFGGGLNIYRKNKSKFNLYQQSIEESSLSNNSVVALHEGRDGTIWVGTDGGGLDKFNPSTEEFHHIKHSLEDENTISANVITSLYEDHLGYIWAGTYSAGLNRYNPSTGENKRFKIDPDDPKSLEFNNVWAILEDYNNELWFGLLGGLAHYNRETQDFEHYKNDVNDSLSLSNGMIIVLFEDSKKNLWVGTQGGLNLFDREKGTFKRFLYNPDDANSIINNNIRALCEDEKGNLLIGTLGGMSVMNLENFQIYSSGFNELLPNKVINGIQEDKNNNLWISTSNGLFSYNPISNELQKFSKSDGLQGNEFNYTSSVTSRKSGVMYFGGLQGLNSFSPEDIKFSTANPKIVITDFKIFGLSVSKNDSVNGKPFVRESFPYLSEITLSHKETVFSIEFASLDYTSPYENKYRYKLEGFDKSWNNTDALRRTATYMNLSPGEYVLTIQGTNSDGIWSKEERALAIEILPPFWKTWWFISFMVMTSFLAVLFVIHQRTAILVKQKRKLEHEIANRTVLITQQNEELLATNEELMATNDQLVETMNHLEATQDKLVEAEKMASLGVLTAGIAHEINNPINFVFAGANSLEDNLTKIEEIVEAHNSIDEKNYKEKLSEIDRLKKDIQLDKLMHIVNRTIVNIKDGAERVSEIVKGLNIFSSSGNDVLVKFDINMSLDRSFVLLKHKYSEKVEVEKKYGDLPQVDCYPSKLEQVFINMISNASDAIEIKGKIIVVTEIVVRKEKQYVHISIEDSGKGMDESVKKRIFEPFYTTKEVGSGTGLGLAISHSIIESHHGFIEVDSTIGVGTTFHIFLPIHENSSVKI
ncbi:MAG: ATP-binding protein [Cyclobacteriaceae bacterium]|nr:ATP-binding protein [Cyclobacteriaceae bacterium]